ncbi:MAG: hypothetical protein D6693_08210 [Planctomycetota bacterium]|nr:MAG: hypothetical protein D6693_08210 [Planctomycetota bacterium]
MISFAVFDENGLDTGWTLRHAHLLGADSVVAPGKISVDGGIVRCEPLEPGSTALAVQWEAGEHGALVLRTCLLPHRERPYLLSLELARRQIMQFFVKLEEWGEFDRPPDDPVLALFDQARTRFTEALIMEDTEGAGGSPAQDAVARQALSLALEAGERLTLAHACAVLDERRAAAGGEVNQAATSGTVPPAVGVLVHPERSAEGLRRVVADSADFITLPMRWSDLEPEEGTYAFGPIDRWIEWAVRDAKMPVVAGPVIDLRPGCVPDWLYIWENDYETLRDLVYEHVKRVVTRYRRVVSRWVIAGGLHVSGNFNLTLEQVVDLTRLCVMVARKLHPRANIRLEIAQPFGEYGAVAGASLAPQLYAEIIAQAGVGIDGFGLQVLMGDAAPGRSTRDLMALADLIDRYAEFQRPLAVSLLGAPAEAPDLEATGYGDVDPGYWREPWSPEQQASWLTHAAVTCLGHPLVSSICWQALYDVQSEADMHAGGLIDLAGAPRPALGALKAVRDRLRSGEPLCGLLRPAADPAGARP